MPLYEYECDVCAHRFERIQKFSDPLVDVCPSCGGHVRKLLSSPAFQFKGTGWYVTDYARKGKGGDSEASKDTTEKKESEKKESAPKSEAPAKESTKKASGKTEKSSE